MMAYCFGCAPPLIKRWMTSGLRRLFGRNAAISQAVISAGVVGHAKFREGASSPNAFVWPSSLPIATSGFKGPGTSRYDNVGL